MAHDLSPPLAAPGLLDAIGPATCPACHTGTSMTQNTLDAGGAWRCVRCGQQWDAGRLAAVAAYAAWVVDRERPDGTR